ncbi:hypothetical protein [Brevibacillus brevis]|uniref:Uncharacterized protein n=1 Tax=Brevibacillus brevis TaxID=1393 RepID=A0ABY9T5M8_BREBE|nr:hypothetical protein [Brevibacillus brevis]WNC14247.1 hypothetical protein RGB73_26795 [Brevibacillus brevis]
MTLSDLTDLAPLMKLERSEVIHLLLTSIAMEEMSLSQLMNAEGEKIQRFLEREDVSLEEFLRVNQSVERMLRSIVSKQILLQFRLDHVLELESNSAGREPAPYKEMDKVVENEDVAESTEENDN